MRLFPLIAWLVCAATAATADEAVFPRGSRIGLVPPAGMKPSDGVAGFRDPKTGAAIVTIEMPAAALSNVLTSLADETLKGQGFTVQARETTKVGSDDALLVSGEQAESGATIPKSFLLAADPSMTALVIAQLPPGAPTALRDGIKASLKSVVLRPPLSMSDQLSSLPFDIVDKADFRPLRIMAGNSVLLTSGPNDQINAAEQPVVIVAQSVMPAPVPDAREAFARSLLVGNSMIKDVLLERSQGFRLGGSDWHEILAKAKDPASNEDVVVMQTIRFGQGGYIRALGIARIAQRDDVLPRFRRVVDSIQLR